MAAGFWIYERIYGMQLTVPELVTVGRLNVRVKATVLHLTSVSLRLVAFPLHKCYTNSLYLHMATPFIGPLLSLGVCASLLQPLLCNPSSSYRVSGGSDHDLPSSLKKNYLLILVPPEKKLEISISASCQIWCRLINYQLIRSGLYPLLG